MEAFDHNNKSENLVLDRHEYLAGHFQEICRRIELQTMSYIVQNVCNRIGRIGATLQDT